jgi:hypothetical protein
MDLGRLEYAAGAGSAAAEQLDAARLLLSELEAPLYRARVEQLSAELGLGREP